MGPINNIYNILLVHPWYWWLSHEVNNEVLNTLAVKNSTAKTLQRAQTSHNWTGAANFHALINCKQTKRQKFPNQSNHSIPLCEGSPGHKRPEHYDSFQSFTHTIRECVVCSSYFLRGSTIFEMRMPFYLKLIRPGKCE